MAELSTQQMLFATEYIKCGNATQAAIKAGYSERTAKQQGSRLLTNVDIQHYIAKQKDNINKDLRMMFADSAVDAYNVLQEIMKDPGAPPKDRIVAARDLLDRAGYKPTEKIQADVQGEVSHTHDYHIEQTINADPETAELLKQLYWRQAGTA